MLRAGSGRVRSVVMLAAVALLLTSATARGQGSTTATVRGNIQDTSGAVLPGATVTFTNTGTKALQNTVSDDRGQYLFAGLFPGTYDLKVELPGFKTYERKALSLSPGDNRGIDIRLDVGQQSELVTVTAQQEVIQTQTGAREGVLTAKQIDNLSIIGRSALELLRILPGVVTEFNQGESVSFGGGGNNTQGYTVNGIRSSSNTVQLDGSSLIDVGSNNGVIISLNTDMIQEVKVQNANFAAESGTGGMSVSGVTKSGTSQFHGQLYDYWRGSELAANDRSNSLDRYGEAEEQVPVSRGQHRRPDRLRRLLHEEPRPALFLRRVRGPAAAGRFGVVLHTHVQPGHAERRFQRAAGESRLEPEQHPAAADSPRLPQCGPARAQQRPAGVRVADGQVPREPLSAAQPQRPGQPVQLRVQPAGTGQPDRLQEPRRLEHQQSHESLCPDRARGGNRRESPRRLVGAGRRGGLADAEHRREPRPLVRGQRRDGAEPVDDERSAGQLQPADARQPLQGSGRARAGRRRHHVQRHLPGRFDQPVSADRHPSRVGRERPGRAICGPRPTTSTRTTTPSSSATS